MSPPRREMLTRLLVGSLGLLLVLAACSSTEPEAEPPTSEPTTTAAPAPTTTRSPATTAAASPTTATEAPAPPLRTDPAPGGTVRVGLGVDLVSGFRDVNDEFVAPTLNPLLAGNESPEIARLVVPGAYRIDAASGELVPWLVEEIPRPANGGVRVTDDGTVAVTYVVRDEAVWEDGTPVTGDDLAFTHQVVAELSLANGLPGDGRLRRAHDLIDSGSIVVDGKSFTALLTTPSPAYEMLFEWVLPAHEIDLATFGEDWNDRLWPSAGPFRFVSFEPSGAISNDPSVVVLERNPNYWEVDPATGSALPYLDRIEMLAYHPGAASPERVEFAMTTGEIDAGLGRLYPSFAQILTGNQDDYGFELQEEWDLLYELLGFSFTDQRFAVNPRSLNEHLAYRQAVLSAVDRGIIAADTGELAMTSILGTALPGRDHGAWAQYDDPVRAGALLTDLGVELDRDLAAEDPAAVYVTSTADETMRIGDSVVAQLAAAGIDAAAEYGDFFGSAYPDGLYDLLAVRQFAGTGGLSGLAETLGFLDPTREQPLLDWTSLGEPAVRYGEVLAEASTELDPDRLAALLIEAESILADNAVVYPLVRRQSSYRASWPERIQGIVPHRLQGWDTWNAAEWWSPQG